MLVVMVVFLKVKVVRGKRPVAGTGGPQRTVRYDLDWAENRDQTVGRRLHLSTSQQHQQQQQQLQLSVADTALACAVATESVDLSFPFNSVVSMLLLPILRTRCILSAWW
jgi:hypothetical protein